ncbi:MAG: Smr/MutS family protein [Dehalococcoidia bacterium]
MATTDLHECLPCGKKFRLKKNSAQANPRCPRCGHSAFIVGDGQFPILEVYLRRMHVEDALFKLDRYLNDAFMEGLSTVRVVHGKGTGTIRKAVRGALASHPLVTSYRPAEMEEGGEGATIVELIPRRESG